MLDRILNGALWLTVMVLISGAAIGALAMTYRGFFNLCAGHMPLGLTQLVFGMLMGGTSFLLTRHANDLMDR